MTPLLEQFASRLEEAGIFASPEYAPGPPPTLTIKAKHQEVGPIVVCEDKGELTVEIGGKHHLHFFPHGSKNKAENQSMYAAASEAADFVAHLMADRVCVTIDYLNDHCIGSSHCLLDDPAVTSETVSETAIGLKGGNIRTARYLWSGPIRVKPNR